MNFNEKLTNATKIPFPPIGKSPPWLEIFEKDQLPLVKNVTETINDITTIEKKNIFANFPVKLILKLDKIYQIKIIPIAI